MHHPLRHIGALGAALCLLLPSAALAETLTVDPADSNDTCTRTGPDRTCKTIATAVTASAAGDTIKILKGTYAEAVSVSGRDGLRIEGAPEVMITGSGTSDVVTIAANNVTLSGVVVDVPANAGSAVVISGTGGTVENVALARNTASTVDDPVVDVTGTATLTKALITQNAGAVGTPAVRSTGAGTTLSDAIVLGLKGPAVTFSSGEANRLMRSILVATEATANAIELTSIAGSTANKAVLADSSVIVGGANSAGLKATATGADTGDLTVDLRHVTIAGSAKGIVLDGTGAAGPSLPSADPAGNITATVGSSIVHGASSANEYTPPALNLTTTANNAKLGYSSSDAPAATGNGEISMGGATNTPDAQLFVPGKLTLRADSPVIDKGAAPAQGDSSTDFEGEPRVVGGASDIGADEYANKPPTARFGVTNTNPRAGELIGFGSLSTDPDQATGGAIREWRWDFGDGKKETTTVGGVAHTYDNPGTYQATLSVVDGGGLTATAGAQTITVRDGKPVDIKIANPVKGKVLRLNRLPKKAKKAKKGTKKKPAKPKIPAALPLRATGSATDESGVKQVQVALRLVKRSSIPKALRPAFKKTATTSATTCEHYIGSKGFEKRPCDKVSYFVARFSNGQWQFNTSKKFRLPPGSYELLVRATDGSDLVTLPSAKAGTLLSVRIR